MTSAQQPKAASGPKEFGKPFNIGVQVTRVRYSPDGTILAAACFNGNVLRILNPEAAAASLDKPPGKFKETIKDLSQLIESDLPPLAGHRGWVTGLELGLKSLFSIDSWGRLCAWSLVSKEPQLLWSVDEAHDGWVRAITQSPDGTRIATCGKDGLLRLWNTADGRRVAELDAKSDLLSVCFNPDGKSVVAGDLYGTVRVFTLRDNRITSTFEAKELHKTDRVQDVGGAKCVLVSRDGKTLFVAGAEPKTGGFVQAIPLLIAFDLATGKRVAQWKGANDNEGYVTDLAWHSNGFVVFTTSGQPGQGMLCFWKPGEEKPFFVSTKQPNCHSVAISPLGKTIAVSATNANSSGNGRVKGAGGDYPANTSPIQLWRL